MQPDRERAQAELPCVWVSAGVLSYRLCDRQYECEDCPLYQALRGGTASEHGAELAAAPSRGDDLEGRLLADLGAGCTLHLDRPYSGEGLWLESEPGGTLRVGMDDYTLRLLQPLDGVVMPRAGVQLPRGAPCAWLNRGRHAIALRCPLACELTEIHPHPALAAPTSEEREADRWWFRAIPHESLGMVPGLHRNEALLSWFLGRVRAVHGQLSAVMHPAGASAGTSLADGGLPLRDLEQVLGRERFDTLVGTLFPVQI
jgi:glycine cleavage system H lipoate-binding protein